MSTNTTKKPNTGRAATPEAEEACKSKIAATLKKKGIRPPVKTAAAKPLSKAEADAALSSLHILPSCTSVSELAGNPKALELAGKLAEAEKSLQKSRDGEGVLTRTLGEARAIASQREKQLHKSQAELSEANQRMRNTQIKLESAQSHFEATGELLPGIERTEERQSFSLKFATNSGEDEAK